MPMQKNNLNETSKYVLRERPLMMSDFRGDGRSEMTPKNRSKIVKNCGHGFIQSVEIGVENLI